MTKASDRRKKAGANVQHIKPKVPPLHLADLL
jgi:hypothetical protein